MKRAVALSTAGVLSVPTLVVVLTAGVLFSTLRLAMSFAPSIQDFRVSKREQKSCDTTTYAAAYLVGTVALSASSDLASKLYSRREAAVKQLAARLYPGSASETFLMPQSVSRLRRKLYAWRNSVVHLVLDKWPVLRRRARKVVTFVYQRPLLSLWYVGLQLLYCVLAVLYVVLYVVQCLAAFLLHWSWLAQYVIEHDVLPVLRSDEFWRSVVLHAIALGVAAFKGLRAAAVLVDVRRLVSRVRMVTCFTTFGWNEKDLRVAPILLGTLLR
jgi:hypothetical protein